MDPEQISSEGAAQATAHSGRAMSDEERVLVHDMYSTAAGYLMLWASFVYNLRPHSLPLPRRSHRVPARSASIRSVC